MFWRFTILMILSFYVGGCAGGYAQTESTKIRQSCASMGRIIMTITLMWWLLELALHFKWIQFNF